MKVGVGDGFVVKIFFPFLFGNGFSGDRAALLFFAANCSGTGALILIRTVGISQTPLEQLDFAV